MEMVSIRLENILEKGKHAVYLLLLFQKYFLTSHLSVLWKYGIICQKVYIILTSDKSQLTIFH